MSGKDLEVYIEVSNWEWTVQQMLEYIDKNIRRTSEKTGKLIKVNTFKKSKGELRSIILNTLEQN